MGISRSKLCDEFVGSHVPDEPDLEGHGRHQLIYGCTYNNLGGLIESAKRIAFYWSDNGDEPSFEWLIELKDGRFVMAYGWHDYTGWDCRSGMDIGIIEQTLEAAAKHLTDDARREYERGAEEE